MSWLWLALIACEPEPAGDSGPSDSDSSSDSGEVDTGTPFDAIDGDALPAGPNPCREATRVRAGRVVDGDTFEIWGGPLDEVHVRIIGLNTPEIGYAGDPDECWAQEAKAFAREVLEGRDVWLTFDAQCTDNYGRLLAYVHTGTLAQGNFSVRGLSTGQGYVLTIPPNDTFDAEFREAQDVARKAELGVWQACR